MFFLLQLLYTVDDFSSIIDYYKCGKIQEYQTILSQNLFTLYRWCFQIYMMLPMWSHLTIVLFVILLTKGKSMTFDKVGNGWKNMFVFSDAVFINNVSASKPTIAHQSTPHHNNILN